MLFDLSSRRKKERPKKLPLKVKLHPDTDWTIIAVERHRYPFLIMFPHFLLPDELSGQVTEGRRDACAQTFWIRGTANDFGTISHLEALARELGVAGIMPEGTFDVPPFSLLLAKIAHSFSVAELGLGSFSPFVSAMVKNKDASNHVQFIGGRMDCEPASNELHEVSFDSSHGRPEIISVRIRLFAFLGTPTYFVAAGRL